MSTAIERDGDVWIAKESGTRWRVVCGLEVHAQLLSQFRRPIIINNTSDPLLPGLSEPHPSGQHRCSQLQLVGQCLLLFEHMLCLHTLSRTRPTTVVLSMPHEHLLIALLTMVGAGRVICAHFRIPSRKAWCVKCATVSGFSNNNYSKCEVLPFFQLH